MKINLPSVLQLLLGLVLFPALYLGQLFTQNFNTSPLLVDYMHPTAPTNSQFNKISGSGAGTTVSVTEGQLRFQRTGSNSASAVRTTSFYPAPGALSFKFSLTVSGNTAATTTAALWQVGAAFGEGVSPEDPNKIHSRVALNLGTTAGAFSLRNIGGAKDSPGFSGKQEVMWIINNSGGVLHYKAPDGSSQEIADDTSDIWVGTTPALKGIAASNPLTDLKNFKFIFNNGSGVIDLDDFEIRPLPGVAPILSVQGIGLVRDFSYSESQGPSSPKSVHISAEKLEPENGFITITPPPSYEVSVEGSAFSGAPVQKSYTGGGVSETNPVIVSVRLKAGLSEGIYKEPLSISGGGADGLTVQLEGVVTKPVLSLGALVNGPLKYPVGTGPSPVASMTISGTKLTDPVTVAVDHATWWEISKDEKNWTTSLSYTPTGGVLSASTSRMYIRLKEGLSVGPYAGMIAVASTGAATQAVPLAGEVLQPEVLINGERQHLSLTGFMYAESQGPSGLQSFTVEGRDLQSGLTIIAPENWQISTNKTFTGSNQPPFTTIVIKKSASHQVSTRTIYVRMKEGLTAGSYAGVLTLSSPAALSRSVEVSGQVSAKVVDMRVYGGSAGIKAGSTEPNSLNRTQFAGQNLGDAQTKTYTIINRGGLPLILSGISVSAADFSVVNGPAAEIILTQNESFQFDLQFKPTSVGVKTGVVTIQNNDPKTNPFTFTVRGTARFCGSPSDIVVAQQTFEENAGNEWLYAVKNREAYGSNTGLVTGSSGSGDQPAGNNLFAQGARAYRVQGKLNTQPPVPLVLEFDTRDVSGYSSVDVSFSLAGFSLGSKDNGMDSYDAQGRETENEEEKVDFVLVEISADGGSRWYPQAKVVSAVPNLAWSFGSAGTVSGSRDYSSEEELTYFSSTPSQKYSQLTIKNVPAVQNLKVRISAQNNDPAEAWIIDNVRIMSTGMVPKIWTGTEWVGGLPQKSDMVIITGDYHTSTGSLEVCQCIINDATVTVGSNTYLVVADQIVNNGEIIVENDGSLVQVNEMNTNSGAGLVTVRRESNMKRLDYTYWSSPVNGQNLKQFSPTTLNNRFYTYDENTDLFETIDPLNNIFGQSPTGFESAAKGYAIRAPNHFSGTENSRFTGVFRGILNNGPHVFPLRFTDAQHGFNLVGNPYSSSIDFYQLADMNSALITKTAYFWTNLNPTPAMQGNGYPGDGYYNNYATLTGTGGIPATVGATGVEGQYPTSLIKTGLGFLVRAKAAGNLTFQNSHRTKAGAGVFFNKKEDVEKDRYWLHLSTPLGVITTALVGYTEGATDQYEADYDAPLFTLGSDALFTEVGDYRLGIQGRALPFRNTDVVVLGTHQYEKGTYLLSVGKREGIFSKEQPIYVKDNMTGHVVNLSEEDYAFKAEKGPSSGRFQIVYKKDGLLESAGATKEDLIVYRDGNSFVLKSDLQISRVEVADASGRLIKVVNPQRKEIRIDSAHLGRGVYFLRIEREGQSVVTRKIVKQL